MGGVGQQMAQSPGKELLSCCVTLTMTPALSGLTWKQVSGTL